MGDAWGIAALLPGKWGRPKIESPSPPLPLPRRGKPNQGAGERAGTESAYDSLKNHPPESAVQEYA